MSTPDAAAEEPRRDPAPQPDATPDEREPVVSTTEREVTLQRSVRYGRLLIGGAVLGALVAVIASLVFPVSEDATYTLAQVTGFMLLIGAVIGLTLGGALGLVLAQVAKRRRGGGVAIRADVR